ncbi:MAG: Response regulator receiver domain [Bacteroidetes bacterium]|nr:Response regulator receiver domain [Bacteroidota bacterium]
MEKKILIISRDIFFHKLLKKLMEKNIKNCELFIYKSKREIDRISQDSKIDFVVLDGEFNSLSAFEVLRILRVEKRIIAPIWFFSDIDRKDYIYKAYAIGASKIIKKTFDPIEIVNDIANILNK